MDDQHSKKCCGKSTSDRVLTIVVILLLLTNIGFQVKDKYFEKYFDTKPNETQVETQEIGFTFESIQDRLDDRTEYLRVKELDKLYYSLPDPVLTEILNKLGKNAYIEEICVEYFKNKKEYLEIWIASEVGDIVLDNSEANQIKRTTIHVELDSTPPENEEIMLRLAPGTSLRELSEDQPK